MSNLVKERETTKCTQALYSRVKKKKIKSSYCLPRQTNVSVNVMSHCWCVHGDVQLKSKNLRGTLKLRYGIWVWGLSHRVLPFHGKMVHKHYQIEITIHPQLFHWPTHPSGNDSIPYHNWEAKRQKGPMFSVMYCLIAIFSWLYPHNRVKRLYPERVLACSLHFTETVG